MSILKVENLCVTYTGRGKKVYAVDDVSFEIEKGDSLGIIGESGSGKSTMALAILKLIDKKTADITGKVIYNNDDLLMCGEARLKQLRWKEIAVVFQKSMNSLSPVHKIGEQFEDVYKVHDSSANSKFIKDHVLKLFELVNLAPRVYDSYPHELSGGMLQRVSIALSLIHDPSLLIMDEATTALDVVTQGQILNEIMKLEKEFSATRMMITHDLSVIATSCKKVIVMYAGRLMEIGYVEDILMNPIHPYTQGLIKSFPSLRGEKKELKAIRGALPDLSEVNNGCIFAARCDYAKDICFKQRPKPVDISKVHKVACHLCGGVK